MEFGDSLQCSQEPGTGHHPEQEEFSSQSISSFFNIFLIPNLISPPLSLSQMASSFQVLQKKLKLMGIEHDVL
jgi:hypothetical protein